MHVKLDLQVIKKWMIACSESVTTCIIRLRFSMQFGIKYILIVFVFVAVALTLLAPIRGMFPPFYYEQYNTVKSRLEAVDGLKIRDTWQHEDMVLEDCGFEINVDGQNASLIFVDQQDWVALFNKIDGIRIPANDHQRVVACEQLKSAGIEIDGLTDVLSNLESVMEFCSNQTETTVVPNAEYDYQKYLKHVSIQFK